MLSLHELTYLHPNKTMLFDRLRLVIDAKEKVALIGQNGIGKSTLLRIICGETKPSSGHIHADSQPYYIPQLFGQFNELSIARALHIEHKLTAFQAIVQGSCEEAHFIALNDDWTIEDRCRAALNHWQIGHLAFDQELGTLSGGEQMKVFLAGIDIHQPDLILLDEPSNHLDTAARKQLYQFIQSTSAALLVVSHDRYLLNLLDRVCELDQLGLNNYGGNYDFYQARRKAELDSLNQELRNKEKTLRLAKQKERETIERQHKLDARGRKKQENAGVARIMLNTLKNNAENSTSALKQVQAEKIGNMASNLKDLRARLPEIEQIKFNFDHADTPKGKILISAQQVNVTFSGRRLWLRNLSFELNGGERLQLSGANGSGKTSLIKLITGELEPQTGTMKRQFHQSLTVDQDYALINNDLNIYEQAQLFNDSGLQEHDIKIRLNRFLFGKETWGKSCSALSGGEKMRLVLCCLTIGGQPPQLLLLDEPTNNLDIQNVEILINAIRSYEGALIVVSHDPYFMEQLNPDRVIELTAG